MTICSQRKVSSSPSWRGTIPGTEYDRFVVGGTAQLEVGDGILVDLIDPNDDLGANVFSPDSGDVFDIVMAQDIVLLGTDDVYELLSLPSLAPGLFFEASVLTSNAVDILRLSVGGSRITAAPEPGSLLLVLLGFAVSCGRLIRSKCVKGDALARSKTRASCSYLAPRDLTQHLPVDSSACSRPC